MIAARAGRALVGLPIVAALYFVIYRSPAQGSPVGRGVGGYLAGVARASALIIRPFDQSVSVDRAHLSGRFALEIVVDCAAFEVQAIFAAAVLVFPASWRRRLLGLATGLALIGAFNVVRIACLYLVGIHAPGWFHVLHEEVFQIGIVLGTCLMFGTWVYWARRDHGLAPA